VSERPVGDEQVPARVLVVNTGSSSLKYQLVDPESGEWSAKGLIERIGEEGSRMHHVPSQGAVVDRETDLPDHAAALELMLEVLGEADHGLDGLIAVGHRVVHGGSNYTDPVIVDDDVEAAIEDLIPLAPLHNPPALVGLRELRRLMPDVPHVTVFDTAFHASMPPEAYTYALPVQLAADLKVRRYGFHGTSYRYVTRRTAEALGIPVDQADIIVCHLGNGASMAAVRGGRSVDTTMGLTPLQGLVMGTRSGDVDPAVVFHLVRVGGLSLDEVDAVLNKQSGLKGLSGSQDMREVRARAEDGDEAARLALDVYAYRIRAYIGAYLAVVPGIRALVFTAGIGENDADLRREVCAPLAHLGIRLDAERNTAPGSGVRFVDDGTGPIRILVVPTDEEAEIARQAAEAVASAQAAAG
jgi:acetate kinase